MTEPAIMPDCTAADTEARCYGACSWSDGGCSGPCNARPDQTTCEAISGCAWSACSGTPPPCSSYSVENCAEGQGCMVVTIPNAVIGE
jgi:hypothetical protein